MVSPPVKMPWSEHFKQFTSCKLFLLLGRLRTEVDRVLLKWRQPQADIKADVIAAKMKTTLSHSARHTCRAIAQVKIGLFWPFLEAKEMPLKNLNVRLFLNVRIIQADPNDDTIVMNTILHNVTQECWVVINFLWFIAWPSKRGEGKGREEVWMEVEGRKALWLLSIYCHRKAYAQSWGKCPFFVYFKILISGKVCFFCQKSSEYCHLSNLWLLHWCNMALIKKKITVFLF